MISLSVSRIKNAKQCMLAFKNYYVTKKWKQVWSQAADDGTAQHTILENFLKGNTAELPTTTSSTVRAHAEDLRKKPVLLVEHDIVFTTGMDLTHPKDWNNAWFRIKIDALAMDAEKHKALVTDWKNGKRWVDSYQLDVYAWGVMNAFPDLRVMAAQYVWLQTGKADRAVYTRKMLPELDQTIREDEAKILSDITNDNCWSRKGFWCTNCPGKLTRACKEWA